MRTQPTLEAANFTNTKFRVCEEIQRSGGRWRETRFLNSSHLCCFLFMATYFAALAWLLMLCYQFSIDTLHNRRARAPALILPDSVPVCSLQTERMNAVDAVSSSKVHPTPSHRKVTTQKDNKKRKKKQSASQFYSF